MLRGVLFDFDDTLYGYAPCNEAGLRAVFEGPAKSVWSRYEAFRECHDRVRTELGGELDGQAARHERMLFFQRMVDLDDTRPTAARLECALAMYAAYWERFLETMEPAPRAHEVLETLSRSYPLALVSNHTSHAQLRKIHRLGLGDYFQTVVTSEEVGAEKPAPGPFQRALERLGIAPEEALMVGDDPRADVEGAGKLGMATVQSLEFRGRANVAHGVAPNVAPGETQSACEVIAELGELPAWIRRHESPGTREKTPG